VEKVRCLAELRARHPQLPITAYGNTASDLGTWVSPTRAFW